MEAALINLTSKIEKLVTRLESVERQLAQGPPATVAATAVSTSAPAPTACEEVGPAQREFDELVACHLRSILSLSKEIGPILGEQVETFIHACEEESKLIGVASRSKKPTPADLPKLLEPLSKLIGKVTEIKEKNGRAKESHHLAALAEGVACLGWVAVEPTPAPYMNDIIPGSEFWTNKILVANKGKDENQLKWAKEFNTFLKNLQSYVKRIHTTGLAWNPRGGDALTAFNSAADAEAPCAGGPPPPPPPPPAGFFDQPAQEAPKGAKPDVSNMFAELQKGTEISKGLKHVSAEQKTKNRSAEEKAKTLQPKEVPKKDAPAAATVAGGKVKAPKPPRNDLSGNKWFIENQVDATIVIDDARKEQSFYVGNCTRTTVQIKGKINSLTIDGCNKSGIVCDTIVAVIELVNSNSCQLQVTDRTACLNVDKCNACQLYLPASALSKEDPLGIYTSKCSAINIVIPGPKPEDDPIELPVPEQYKTIVVNGHLVTECTSHGGF